MYNKSNDLYLFVRCFRFVIMYAWPITTTTPPAKQAGVVDMSSTNHTSQFSSSEDPYLQQKNTRSSL